MLKVDVPFSKQSFVCGEKMFRGNGRVFRDVHLLGEQLCQSVHEDRLPGSLSVEPLNDFRCEGLSDFVRILPKQLLHLFAREVRQVELVMDIKRRNRPVVIQLRDVFHADNPNAIKASEFVIVLVIDAPKRVKKSSCCRLRNVIKFINDKDNPLIVEQPREFLKKPSQ